VQTIGEEEVRCKVRSLMRRCDCSDEVVAPELEEVSVVAWRRHDRHQSQSGTARRDQSEEAIKDSRWGSQKIW
jgi:hypothetical protein